MKRLLNKQVRLYIYGVAIAALTAAVGFGYLPPASGGLLVPLIMAILNVTPDEVKEDSADG